MQYVSVHYEFADDLPSSIAVVSSSLIVDDSVFIQSDITGNILAEGTVEEGGGNLVSISVDRRHD